MMLKRSTSEAKPKGFSARLVRAGLAGALAVASAAGLATGCLDRKVVQAQPTTSNVFVDQIVQTAVDKIDLLFMIDNSVSMADKQEILKTAVPVLLGRLVQPICVDATGAPTNPPSTVDATGQCASPNQPEFAPIGDIHIGIVSSSLGSHGGNGPCNGAPANAPDPTLHDNDKGELIGIQRTGLTTWNNSGFLAWDPSGTKNTPPGVNDANTLNTQFAAMIQAVGENGCGYEASLEAWYRFLVDPEPPDTVVRGADGFTHRQGLDMNLMTQRQAFLRPDSLVAVIMLTDENDCSILDANVGWFVSSSNTTTPMPKSTAACATNPNDVCCRSCAQAESGPPTGCMPLAQDPICMGAPTGKYNTWAAIDDSPNLRCYNQKQRFGFDLLYPVSRYVNALKSSTLQLESDPTKTVTNPLYDTRDSGKAPRDPSLVFFAGIIGVPWQDISTQDSLSGTGLTYLNATQLTAQGRWAQILGDSNPDPNTHAAPVPPSDPYMVESIKARSGVNPNTQDAIAAPDSTNPQASKINGHEWNIPNNDDLQYACIFPLPAAKQCPPGNNACDCSANKSGDTKAVTTANSPLCQPPGGGAPSTTQYFAKGYPGLRELQTLHDYGDNAIVASICPKNTVSANPGSDPNYGYNPAVGAIIDRLKDALKGKCLPRAIQTDPTTGQVECQVIEAQKAGQCGDCTQAGRSPAPQAIHQAVFNQLSASHTCGQPGQAPCDDTGFCMCQIDQEQGDALTACQQQQTPAIDAGYCYIDETIAKDSPSLKNCPDNQKRILRFLDSQDGTVKTPAQGAIAFIACLGANINGDGGTTVTPAGM